MRPLVNWSTVLIAMATVAVISLCGYLVATWPPAPPSAPRSASESAVGGPPRAHKAQVLVVIGDSFTASSTASVGPEWPGLVGNAMHWRVYTNAVNGSGYLSPGQGKPFGARVDAAVQHAPDVIVVAGGVADLGYPIPQVSSAADNVVRQLVEKAPSAKVVLVSPFSNGPPGPLTSKLSSSLQQIAQKNRVPYIDAIHCLAKGSNLFASDGVHPTKKGQQRLARRIEKGLMDLGIISPAGQSTN